MNKYIALSMWTGTAFPHEVLAGWCQRQLPVLPNCLVLVSVNCQVLVSVICQELVSVNCQVVVSFSPKVLVSLSLWSSTGITFRIVQVS